MAAGELVSDDLVGSVVHRRLSEHDWNYGFIIDGFPRNQPQARFFLESYDLDAVILLEVPDQLVKKRILSRRLCSECGVDYNLISHRPAVVGVCDVCRGRLVARDDDTPQAVQGRLRDYHDKTRPVLTCSGPRKSWWRLTRLGRCPRCRRTSTSSWVSRCRPRLPRLPCPAGRAQDPNGGPRPLASEPSCRRWSYDQTRMCSSARRSGFVLAEQLDNSASGAGGVKAVAAGDAVGREPAVSSGEPRCQEAISSRQDDSMTTRDSLRIRGQSKVSTNRGNSTRLHL